MKKPLNDWQKLAEKPILNNQEKSGNLKIEEPYKRNREDSRYSMLPTDAGSNYSFAVVPSRNGDTFCMSNIAIVRRHKFFNPKTGEDYFDTRRMPMNPADIFDMSVLDKKDLTEEDKITIARIKRHGELIKRWKDLNYCKIEGVNFKYATGVKTIWNDRIKSEAVTGFFGVWTRWTNSGTEVLNTNKDYKVKFIYSRYNAFQDKFRGLLEQTDKSHSKLQPNWYEDYFSSYGGIKGILDAEFASMKVGGRGCSVKLVKLGKDPIDDSSVGVTSEIKESDIIMPKDKADELSHLHYYMMYDSTQELWQDTNADLFEEGLAQLEHHVQAKIASGAVEVKPEKAQEVTPNPTPVETKETSQPPTDKPF